MTPASLLDRLLQPTTPDHSGDLRAFLKQWGPGTPASSSAFERLVQVAFSQRRKLLRHTLGHWLEEKGVAGFDVQRRAQEVPVEEYLALARRVGQAAASQ